VELWTQEHGGRRCCALRLLRECFEPGHALEAPSPEPSLRRNG
jgi:hypothetical protein